MWSISSGLTSQKITRTAIFLKRTLSLIRNKPHSVAHLCEVTWPQQLERNTHDTILSVHQSEASMLKSQIVHLMQGIEDHDSRRNPLLGQIVISNRDVLRINLWQMTDIDRHLKADRISWNWSTLSGPWEYKNFLIRVAIDTSSYILYPMPLLNKIEATNMLQPPWYFAC